MQAIQCSQCYALNRPDATLCARCGSRLGGSPTIAVRVTVWKGGRKATVLESVGGGAPFKFEVGQVFHDRYTLIKPLGEGAMAEVWLTHLSNKVWRPLPKGHDRKFAFKLMRPEFMADPAIRSRACLEGRTLAEIDHPNVVKVFEYFELHNTIGLVLEYMNKGSLGRLLERKGPMAHQEAVMFMRKSLAGLQAVHEAKLIHRDMKPDNVLLSKVNGEIQVKIADLGIVKEQGKSFGTYLTKMGSGPGTLVYMAPEQFQRGESSIRSDIYSSGIMLYELLTGCVPFTGNDYEIPNGHVNEAPDWSRLPNSTPKNVRQALKVALEKDPTRRFSSSRAFADALRKNARVTTIDDPKPPSPILEQPVDRLTKVERVEESGEGWRAFLTGAEWLVKGALLAVVVSLVTGWGPVREIAKKLWDKGKELVPTEASRCKIGPDICIKHYESPGWCEGLKPYAGTSVSKCPKNSTSQCRGLSGGAYVEGNATAYYYNHKNFRGFCDKGQGRYTTFSYCQMGADICIEHHEGPGWCERVKGVSVNRCPHDYESQCRGLSGGDYSKGDATAYYYNHKENRDYRQYCERDLGGRYQAR